VVKLVVSNTHSLAVIVVMVLVISGILVHNLLLLLLLVMVIRTNIVLWLLIWRLPIVTVKLKL